MVEAEECEIFLRNPQNRLMGDDTQRSEKETNLESFYTV